jgi:hypothetical protein
MSLTTDGLALGAAFAVAVGSTIQLRQAFAELNEKTPFRKSVVPLLLAAIGSLFSVIIPRTDVTTMGPRLIALGLLTAAPTELTPEQAAEPTLEQTAALKAGQTAELTPEQTAVLNALRVRDLKKWLGWFLGWFFIVIGALFALVGTALTLAKDLWPAIRL